MTIKNKNLLLVDYQLDNIQYIHNIKLDTTDIIIIDLNNIDIDNEYNKIGLLVQNIGLNVQNILSINPKIELINESNFTNYLNIDFNYELNEFTFNYTDSIILYLKNLTIYGGIFYLSDNILNCIINNENGTITINNINIGEYLLYVNYNIFSLTIKKKIIINVVPNINYNEIYNIYENTIYISPIPTIIPNNLNGIFSIVSNNLPIEINTLNGSFTVQSLNVGNYEFIINYFINNILYTKLIKLIVEPVISYNNTTFEIKYNEIFIIDKPIINNKEYYKGEFLLDDTYNNGFIINKISGEIIINQNKNLKTRFYELKINYLQFQIKIKINIIPNINYIIDNLIENDKIIIKNPIITSSSKVFFSTSTPNVSIHKKNGTITLNDFESGNYNLIINVKYDEYNFKLHLPVIILPFINFSFDDNINFSFQYFKNIGEIIIKDYNNSDFTNEILHNKKLNVGNYNFILYYIKNSYTIKKEFEINILPKIIYNNKNKYTIEENIIIEPIEQINNGLFIYDGSDVTINKYSGIITVNKPEIKEYLINYIYNFNNINYKKFINFTIVPTIIYQDDYIFTFGIENIINKPIVNPINGKFTIDKLSLNKYIQINDDGSIFLDKDLSIGDYNISINYIFNNIIANVQLNITVIPNINYNKEFFFDKNINNIIKPNSLSHNNIIFKIVNSFNNMFTINNFGEIFISKDINIGFYLLEIICIISNIKTIKTINIHISPEIVYNETNFNIKYGNELIIDKPIIYDKNGEFSIDINNKEFNINNKTGEIIISNKLLSGIFNFNVIYILEKAQKKINFNINVSPCLKYNIINIDYNKKYYSDKPEYSPPGGIFTCIYNKNVIIDNESGVLIFSKNIDVGSYNILIKYIHNNIFTEFNCVYNILPTIIYNDEFYFKNNNFKIKPQKINPKNGTFNLNNENFTINNNGEIKLLNTKLVGTYYLNIEYENILKTNKIIKINIEPDINYTDVILNYKDTIKISPNNNYNKGIFTLLNYNDIFNINDCGIIVNFNDVNVGKYNLNINYKLDDININKTVNLTIVPLVNINSLFNIDVEPKNGKFKLNCCKNNICIDENCGKISLDDNTPLGNHNIDIIYTYNNISTNKTTTIFKKLTLEYEKNISIVKGIETICKPNVNYLGGKFKMIKNYKNIKIDEISGFITINKEINIGNYNLEIEYTINEHVVTCNINIIVLQPFNYNSSIYEFYYGDKQNIKTNINLHNSEFYILPKIDGIDINKDNGDLNINMLVVGSYNFNINCFSNEQLLNTTIKINILPVIKYEETMINIKYGDKYLSNIPFIYPDNGIFYTNSNIINLKEDGSFSINENIDVNIYYFDIIYEINNMKSTSTLKVIINPLFEYKCSEISIDHGNEYFTDLPNYYPKDGIFTIVNQPIGITIQKNGIINIDKNLPIGIYDLSVLYKINKINLTNTIKINILPQFYYNIIDLSLYNNYFIGFYKNKEINIDCLNDIYQCDKVINTSKPNFYNKGYFTIQNSESIININGDNGVMTLKNNNLGIYNFNINYNVLNINKIYNYQVLITPLFKYDSNNFNKKYKQSFTTKPPIVYPEGGLFYFPENYEFFSINYNTGEVTCNINTNINIYKIVVFYEFNEYISYNELIFTVYPDTYINNIETIQLGKHNIELINYYDELLIKNYEIYNNTIEFLIENIGCFNITLDATFKNINFFIDFTIKILPTFNYEKEQYFVDFGKTYIINKPTVNYDNGYFEITNKIKGITIDKITGEIYIFDKLIVNDYIININYILNDVIATTQINIVIKPLLEYNITKYEFYYGDKIIIENPKISPINGTFNIDKNNEINIDKNGNLLIDNINVGNYNFNINYIVNNIKVFVNINILIKPKILYENTYLLYYGNDFIINPIILNPPQHVIKTVNMPVNIIFDENTGSIKITNNCVPDIYYIELKYNINDIETKTSFNIIIEPFKEKTKTIKQNHGINELINLQNDLNILYSLNNKLDKTKFYFKDNKLFGYNLNVNIYSLKINYKINNISNDLDYNIIIYPNIIYEKLVEFNFGDKILISPITYSPHNGYFKLINDNFIIDRYGCITQKQNTVLSITTYNIIVEYAINKIKTTFNLQIKINPLLTFDKNIYEGFHNEILIINPTEYLPKNLLFSLDNNKTNYNIDSNGKITIQKLNIGNYSLKVNYDIKTVLLNIIIKPIFFYNENNVILEFKTLKTFIPSISQNNGKFYFKDFYNNIIIDENTGIIKVHNLLPDVYNIVIYYSYNDIEVNTKLHFTIKPVFKYNNNNLLIKYNTDLPIIVPTVNPIGGKFFTSSNSVYIDENNGNITINNKNIGKYNIEINYIYNNQQVTNNIIFDIIPVVTYNSYNYTFYYGIENKIEKPIVNPDNGKFSLINDSKYITINNNGIITINSELDVGTYDILVLYEYNKIEYNSKITINIHPYIFYDNVIIEFQNNTLIIEPFYLISNQGFYDFSIDNYDLILFSDGKITNFNCLNIGTYKIFVNYKYQNTTYQTYFLCQIVPIVIFTDNTVYLYPNHGELNYDNRYLEIKDNNIIYKNIYDDIQLQLTYKVNNVEKKILLQYLSKPIKVFDSDINCIYTVDTIINSYVKSGNISSDDKPKNLIIDNLNLNIINLEIGIYFFTINYKINNLTFNQNIKITIYPKFYYENKYFEIDAYMGNSMELPIMQPDNGKLTIKQYIKNIGINYYGTINSFNVIPNIYNITVQYTVNNITSYDNLTICCKPSFTMKKYIYTINYNEPLIITDFNCYPYFGHFTSSIPITNYNKNEIIFNSLQDLNIGTHNININYICNDITTTLVINLCIKPTINYFNKIYKMTYGEQLVINPPQLSHNNGIFSINNDKLIIFNDGSIQLNNNLDIGNYNLEISYLINNFIIKDFITLTIEPYLYYDEKNYTLIYNKDKLQNYINSPKYYPTGGIFYIDISNQQLTINQDNGIIETNNLNIGNYNINVFYKFKKTILKTTINININPYIIYNLSVINIKYKTLYTIEQPITSHVGGAFFSKNLPKGVILNSKNGTITLNQKEYCDIGFYNIIINYHINKLITTTNIYINIS